MSKLANLSFRPIAAMAAALLICTTWTNAHAQETCERAGIEFGFFNGVQTIFDDAQEVVDRFLPEQYGRTTPDGQPISYTLYYNDTEGWADFVETFEQRLQEHNGVLSQRFELFFSSLQGGGSWWSHITETVPALGNVLTGIVQTFQAFLTNRLVEGTGDPSTAAVSQRHREQIDHAVAMDKGLLLFAHSQGNLFANQAYDHARSRVGAESVRVVHVAPPSPRQIGNYTLANLDMVINLLRATGFVLQNSQTILPYAYRPPGLNGQRDLLGHGLLEIYLNPLVPRTSAAIRWHVEQAIDELARSRPLGPGGTNGIPLPPYEEIPWRGGSQPDPVYTTTPPTHRLDQVQYRGEFVCRVHQSRSKQLFCSLVWMNRPFSWSVELTGLNINGRKTHTVRQRWQIDDSPWDIMTRVSNFPQHFHSPMNRKGFFPEEAQGWQEWPVGAMIRSSTLTYRSSQRDRQGSRFGYLGSLLWTQCNDWPGARCGAQEQIGFINGWSDPGRSGSHFMTHFEPYRAGSSALANQGELDAWRRRFEQHQTDNYIRRMDHMERLLAYEQRQRRLLSCTAPVVPGPDSNAVPTVPAFPSPSHPNAPGQGVDLQPAVPPPQTAT